LSYGLALEESASDDDMVFEAAGVRFVAAKVHLPFVVGLRLAVEQSFGRDVLVASHPTFDPGGSC
jgi:hypothetical protein